MPESRIFRPELKGQPVQRIAGHAGLVITVAGLCTSPALLSIGTILVILSGLSMPGFLSNLRGFIRRPEGWALGALTLFAALSWFWTFNTDIYMEQMRVKLPLIFAPFALHALGPYSRDEKDRLVWVLLFSTFVVAVGTATNYFLNMEEINHLISISKPVPVWLGINHIYFSIILAFSILGGIHLARRHEGNMRYLAVALCIVNFICLHLFTARTGLGGFYLAISFTGFRVLLRRKQIRLALTFGLLLVIIPVLSYFLVPSLRNRIDNTFDDLKSYFSGHDPNYWSISTRIVSWETALDVTAESPLIGVGAADLKQRMWWQYSNGDSLLCPENFELPHNQFLQYLAGLGIIGGALFLLWLCWPLLTYRRGYGDLFEAFYVMIFAAMMFESMLERQVGIMFICIFTLILMDKRDAPASSAA